MTMPRTTLKTVRDQVREIQKLVLDAQDQLDLAVRGLRLLEARLDAETASGVASSDQDPGGQ